MDGGGAGGATLVVVRGATVTEEPASEDSVEESGCVGVSGIISIDCVENRTQRRDEVDEPVSVVDWLDGPACVEATTRVG